MEEKDRRCPRGKLHCFNWLEDIPGTSTEYDIVEVQFKNTRKGYYRNSLNLPLETGDMVAVEASPGHDIGSVTLTGKLVALQMRRAGVKNEAEIQPVVATAIAFAVTMGRFTISNAVAVALVFTGVFLVTKSKSHAEMSELGQGQSS